MSFYFRAQIKINDTSKYKKYIDEAKKIFSKFNGTSLVVDDYPKALEGKWKYTRSVIIKFKSVKDFNEWYHTSEYQLF